MDGLIGIDAMKKIFQLSAVSVLPTSTCKPDEMGLLTNVGQYPLFRSPGTREESWPATRGADINVPGQQHESPVYPFPQPANSSCSPSFLSLLLPRTKESSGKQQT